MLIHGPKKKFWTYQPSWGGAAAIGWTPANLGANLIVWLKADAGITLSGSSVTQWTDQASGIAFTNAPIGSTPPTFSSTGFNSSYPGVIFTNTPSTGLYSGASSISFGSANSTGTFAAVVNISNTSTNADTLLGWLATGDSNENSGPHSVNIRTLTGPNSMQVVQNSSGFTNDNYTTGTNYRMLWEFDGTNETSYYNNVQQSQTALNFTFGASGTGNGGLGVCNVPSSGGAAVSATVAEVVITKTAMSSADRANLDGYFKAKWGL